MVSRQNRAVYDFLSSLAIMFAAVTLGTLQFIQNAMPSPHLVRTSLDATLIAICVAIFLPTIVLTSVDRFLAVGDVDGRRVRTLRIIVFTVAAVLVSRQVQLYFGLTRPLFEVLESVPVLALVAFVLSSAFCAWAVRRWYKNLSQYFFYASPVAVLLIAFAMMQMGPATAPTDAYAREVPATGDHERPPVFVIAFDEVSFRLVSTDDGLVNRELYPNLAEVADDGVWFTNATTNHFHTPFIIPPMAEAAADLRPEYDLTIYDQFFYTEKLLMSGCGEEYTCRGTHLLSSRAPYLGKQLLLRALWEVAPRDTEPALAEVVHALGHDHPYPHTDPLGIHTFTPDLYDIFLAELDASTAYGRVHLYHPLLPHAPFVYDADGSLRTAHPSVGYEGESGTKKWELYRRQMMHTDALIGGLMDKLRTEGLYEDSIIIITGDHGLRKVSASIDESIDVDDDLARVPLIIKAPGLVASVSDVDYQHLDFAATLYDLTGIPAPTGVEGVSALSPDRPAREKVFYASAVDGSRYWEYQLTGDEWVYVAEIPGGFPGSHEDPTVANADDGQLPPARP